MPQILLYILLASLLSCTSTPKESGKEPKAENTWAGDMQHMSQDVRQLVPYLYDREAFQDPRNHDLIHQYLRDFSQSAKHVQPEMGRKYLGDDLLVDYALSNLTQDLNRSVQSFEAGQLEYARATAKASLTYCFQCHSVTHEGSSAAWDIDKLQKLNLAPLEKADLLVATRRYDKALNHMENLLNSPEFLKTRAFEFEALLRRYLALIIRVEKAPQRASRELNKVIDSKDTPHYIREQALGWEQSLKAWAKERAGEERKASKSAKGLFAMVDKHFSKASGLQHFEKDHAGDVEYLRATEQLHQGLKILKTPEDQAKALFLLGRAYEVLDELGSWNLHETYYEACIDKDPHSASAQNCYSRLEASLYMGYSGSSGTHLPQEEADRLKHLREKIQTH